MSYIKENFTIKDLENISKIKAHTIRIWEKRFNLLAPKRTNTNIRFYSHENLQKFLNVVLLYNNNFKISKIAKMRDEQIIEQSRKLAFQNARNDQAINSFKLSMFQFDKVLFNDNYQNLLHEMTFQEIFQEIFIPILSDIGLLWQTGTLLPAHEHFISNLITQKVQINIEKLQYNIPKTNKTFVLFLPENEAHELGLLYLNYELILRGNKTVYLGRSLPLTNLDYFLKKEKEICFVTSMTIMPHDRKVKNYFNEIDTILKNTNHELIAIGHKTNLVNTSSFKAKIKLYTTTTDLLKEL